MVSAVCRRPDLVAGLRRPTPHEIAYAWHANALLGAYGDEVIINPDEPQCGWFQRKLVKGGPMVPARIWLFFETDDAGELVDEEVLQCEVNGERADAVEQWSYLAGHPITEQQFSYMTALSAHVREYEPSHPLADPRKPVDWLKAPLPQFNPRRSNTNG